MTEISGVTHEFRHGCVPGDGTCLYWAFILTCKLLSTEIFGEDLSSKLLMEVLIEQNFQPEMIVAINEGLRIQVANYIRKNTDMHRRILDENTKYKTIEEYCSAIERGKLWGGDFELKALSDLYNIIICVIYRQKISADNYLIPSYYGEDNPLATKCVYIYHDENHFDPLYMVNMENSNDKETIFDPNDQMVNDLLKKFIKEKFNYDVKLGLTKEASTTTGDENNSETEITKESIEVEDIRDEFDPLVNQQQIKDLPIGLNNEHQEEKVECEEEPNNKLENVIEDNDKIDYNSESPEAKPES